MQKTQNYQLNQYEPQDNFLRTDFNADNQKIDAALAQKCEIYIGNYTGDGRDSRAFSLGFQPKAVLLTSAEVIYEGGAMTVLGAHSQYSFLAITEDGFQINHATERPLNLKDNYYCYVAFR